MDIAYTFAGFAVGFIVGMTGVGGGSLMTPILVLLFGIKPALAVGTDLLYASITKGGGIFVHHRQGTIQWRIVGLLSLGSLPTSILTVAVLQELGSRGVNYEPAITSSLGIALILTSMVLVAKDKLLIAAKNERLEPIRALHRRYRPYMTIAGGALIGALVTLSSVGAGAIGVAMLYFLYPWSPAKSIIGTDLAHAVPLTAIAGLGHVHLGSVDFSLLANLLLGSLPGIYLGSHLGIRLPDRVTRPVLAGMLLLIGVKFAAPVLSTWG